MPLIRAFSKEFFLSVLRYNYKFHSVHAQHKLSNNNQQGFALCASKKALFSLMSVGHLPESRNKQQDVIFGDDDDDDGGGDGR